MRNAIVLMAVLCALTLPAAGAPAGKTLSVPAEVNVVVSGQARAAAPETAPLSAATGDISESLRVHPPDLDAVRAQDAADENGGPKGPLRIGVYQPLLPGLSISAQRATPDTWRTAPGGRSYYAAHIHAPGAAGLRIELTALDLPEGAAALVYNLARPDEVYGPFTGIPEGDGVLWTPTCFGEDVVLEIQAPMGARVDGVRVEAARVAYIYRDISKLMPRRANAGSCNLDLTCYPDWETASLGVAGLGSLGISGAIWCTGSLLADLDPCSEAPYFLTANHCVDTNPRAASVEFYWLYQTGSCDGTAPDPALAPRTTGGADRLAHLGGRADIGGGNDFCFLRMRNMPPDGLTWLGWSAAPPPATGTPVTCIHHPRGDFKRITFGALTNTANPHANWFHEATWNAGTTEPGSSGSPLLLSDTQQIIGQLWGGGASCLEPEEPDYYGRFDRTFPLIEEYLRNPIRVGFEQIEISTLEDSGPVTVRVALNLPAGSAGASVDYAAEAGAAQAGVDFIPVSGTLHFAPGETEAVFEVPVIADTHTEPDETVLLRLENPSCVALDPATSTAVLVILDDDLDSDGDGVSDYDEIHGTFGPPTDPFSADTDGDGLTDYEELFGVYGYVTDPTRRDTDGDGIPDYDEILLGLNPLDPDDAERLPSLRSPWFE